LVRGHRGFTDALNATLVRYNTQHPHQERGINGQTPAKALFPGIRKANRKEEPANLKAAT